MSAHRHEATDWDDARRRAADAVVVGPVVGLPLLAARGAVLAGAVATTRPLPHYDSSAMDGWAVRGAGPWPLTDGVAAPIVTGGVVPDWCDAVVPTEQGSVRDGVLSSAAHLPHGRMCAAPATRPRSGPCWSTPGPASLRRTSHCSRSRASTVSACAARAASTSCSPATRSTPRERP
ncbi:hypothetical protein [Rathayibacter sp. VKM Ac-2630]|uniref:hypothetical protein n=1 Tax=Rathayibacter sp. VKM Ac-2630 TaxID=1938617 RepID=UPI000980FB2D|nr:hypothetical protein [Rathayibacter sp. VKM Ac-2630]OOB89488.1 hypothetical protein B0T42_17120 [Rathayibacter sp. VKM Ac-2630]